MVSNVIFPFSMILSPAERLIESSFGPQRSVTHGRNAPAAPSFNNMGHGHGKQCNVFPFSMILSPTDD
jgi:hypothetical protein